MTEIEVKILEIDPTSIENRLRELGAQQVFQGELHALFFDFPTRSISQQGDVLRLRKEGTKTVLAYKHHVSREGAKIMEELETEVLHMENIQKILNYLGLSSIKETHKIRTEYHLGNASVVLDDYQGELADIPVFLEIEAPTVEAVYRIAHQLGFPSEACKNWSTSELVTHYFG